MKKAKSVLVSNWKTLDSNDYAEREVAGTVVMIQKFAQLKNTWLLSTYGGYLSVVAHYLEAETLEDAKGKAMLVLDKIVEDLYEVFESLT